MPLRGHRTEFQQRIQGLVEHVPRVGGQGQAALGRQHPAVLYPKDSGLFCPGEDQAQHRQFSRTASQEYLVADALVNHIPGAQQRHQLPGIGQAEVPVLRQATASGDELGQLREHRENRGIRTRLRDRLGRRQHHRRK